MTTDVVRFHITIPADVADRLKADAEREHRPLTHHIRKIVCDHDAEERRAAPPDDRSAWSDHPVAQPRHGARS